MKNPSRRILLSGAAGGGALLGLTHSANAARAERRTGPVVPNEMKAYFDEYHFAPAFNAAGLLFVSGQIGIDAQLKVPSDPSAQADLAFRNLALVLARAGRDLSAIVSLTSHHTGDVSKIFDWFAPVKDRYIKAPYPSWTAVGVTGLAVATAVVEISAIARV